MLGCMYIKAICGADGAAAAMEGDGAAEYAKRAALVAAASAESAEAAVAARGAGSSCTPRAEALRAGR